MKVNKFSRMLPNCLSFLRFPLAFLFLSESTMLRCTALVLALTTDILDGYFARKYNVSSRLGTLLDPLSDKFFVMFILVVYLSEMRLSAWQAISLLSRDFAVILFGLSLIVTKKLSKYEFRAIWCGKITTCMQIVVLFGLACGFIFPFYIYGCFIFLGFLAFVELFLKHSDSEIAITS